LFCFVLFCFVFIALILSHSLLCFSITEARILQIYTLLTRYLKVDQTTPTPSQVGKDILQRAKDDGRLKDFVPQGQDEIQLPDLSNVKEAEFCESMTPVLASLVPDGLILVNSESFSWIMTSSNDNAHKQQPDFFVSHPAIVELRKPVRANTDYYYGVLADFRLRDQLGGILDCKLHTHPTAFGELIIHLQNLCHKSPEHTYRGVLFGQADQPIYFVSMRSFVVIEIVKAKWSDFGLKDYFKRFLTPTSSWAKALTQLCSKLNLSCEVPGAQNSLFLGMGTYGRVFRVSHNGLKKALKVVLKENEVLTSSAFDQLQKIQASGRSPVVTVSDWATVEHGAGYLMDQVGNPPSVKAIGDRKSIFDALFALHNSGFVHGDCRVSNAIVRRSSGILWIDFIHFMNATAATRKNDVILLVKSIYEVVISLDTSNYGVSGHEDQWRSALDDIVESAEKRYRNQNAEELRD
jgi:hypothetical protein